MAVIRTYMGYATRLADNLIETINICRQALSLQ